MDRVYLPFYRSLMIKDQGEEDKDWQEKSCRWLSIASVKAASIGALQ